MSTLAFAGDAYVSGLTLAEAEERIAVQLNDAARRQNAETEPALPCVGQAGRPVRASTITCSEP